MRNLTDRQKQVVAEAKARLENEPWFRGVCLDNLPEDFDIERDGVKEVVEQLVLDTVFFDAPNHGF